MPALTFQPSGTRWVTSGADLDDAVDTLRNQGFTSRTVEPSRYPVQQTDLRHLWLTYVDSDPSESVHFDGFSDEAIAYILTQIGIPVHGLCAYCYAPANHAGPHVYL